MGVQVFPAVAVSRAGEVLAFLRYAPATANYFGGSQNALVDASATNLTLTFVAPPSGNVKIELIGDFGALNTGVGTAWGIREGSVTLAGQSLFTDGGLGPQAGYASFIRTGLTPGQQYSYKWAHAGNGGTTKLMYGPDRTDPVNGFNGGPAIMIATAL